MLLNVRWNEGMNVNCSLFKTLTREVFFNDGEGGVRNYYGIKSLNSNDSNVQYSGR